ncbi:MAG: VOC family protein [Acidobacteria bacterium]|nr:VOC family protein [Acidobacteriota bacterium]
MGCEMAATPVRQIFETHLTVRDLDRSVAFYRDVVGLEMALRNEERNVAFFWVGGRGTTMLGLWAVGSSPLAMKLHTAFAVDLQDLLAAPEVLRKAGVTPLDFYSRPAIELSVLAWMPAASVYFEDPDGHSLEYIAMLPNNPRPEVGIVSYSEWIKGMAAAR